MNIGIASVGAMTAGRLVAANAGALEIALKPPVDARLGYEHVDQDGIARSADAVTLRLRSGVEPGDGPLTSIQTPLASFFRFQGRASKFTATPPNGIRDAYATVAANWKHDGWLCAYGLGATWHRLDSDCLSQHYGNEPDLIASAKIRRYVLAARRAHYHADGFATDTDKLLVSAEWAFNQA